MESTEAIEPDELASIAPTNAYEFLRGFWENFLEKPLHNVGLSDPYKRFTVLTIVGTSVMFYFKPKAQFLDDGSARPWSLTSPDKDGSTPFPFWFPPVLGALLLTFFV